MVTDCDFILQVLADGHPHTLNEILQRSFAERGCGLTVHSRVAELRKQGYVVEHANIHGAARGAASTYRLVSLTESPVSHLTGDTDGSAGQISLEIPRGAYEEVA